jgi:signal transduction histidine kinase
MTLTNLFLIISFFTDLGLGVFVLVKSFGHVNKKLYVIFFFLCLAAALWILTAFMVSNSKVMMTKLFWIRSLFGVSSFIGPLFLHFSLNFPNYPHTIGRAKIALLYLPALVFLASSQTELTVKSIVRMEPSINEYGILHGFFSLYLIVCLGSGLYFLLRTYVKSAGVHRLQIKYYFLGMLLTTTGAVSTNIILPLLGSSKYARIGPSFTMFHVVFTTYAILKHRLMDINIILRKGTTYFLLVLLLLVPSFLLIIMGQRLFFAKVNYLFSCFILCVLFLAALFYQKIKPKTERVVEQFFFRDLYNYRQTLAEFSKAMVSILDLRSLSSKIIETITNTMNVEKASLFLLNEEKGDFDLLESKKVTVDGHRSGLPKGDPLPSYLQKLKEVVVREELLKGIRLKELNSVVQSMTHLEAEVSIPLVSKGKLIGMINLGHRFRNEIYSHEDIELLSMLGNQTSIAIENAKLYEDLKRSKSYIRRADRLASLGTLTAGLAHEIRNPLVAIKTLTQLLPDRLEDEEFRNHFLQIASGEVDRISSLVNELLEFARPSEPKLEREDINAILEGMLLLISTETKKKFIQIVKEYTPDVPSVTVDREQIKQVFLNVLLNALDATPENGTITVKTRSFSKPGGEHYVQVEFTDTGCGIPSEYLEDIFTPFFTTKTKGSGLGLSISNQIIQDHKGYIDVTSYVNRGSTFFINLPVSQDHPKRRKDDPADQRNYLNPIERR